MATGVLASTLLVTADPAQAARDARYAAIVVDANSGKTLHSENSSSRRYPASLTKMMTLYLTFEAMAAGKIGKSTQVPFSAQAAAKPPTKLGVPAGRSVTVEAAILALVTKSANDAATALGEMLGGSEAGFARMMTAKARQLGMANTVFRNPSGLPDPGQFTTARDMATLGLALREHYPQYYAYFSTRSFTFGRQRMANHNRLLGRIKGVDGIKTGYIRASGFNLVTSVNDGNRRLVAVVMGGASGSSRDARMAELIRTYLPQASGRKGGPLVASAARTPIASVTEDRLPKRAAPRPNSRPDLDYARTVEAIEEQTDTIETAAVAPLVAAPKPKAALRAAKAAAAADVDPTPTSSIEPSGWVVQVASSPSKSEASATLQATQRKAGNLLASANGYTVPFEKDGVTYHRVRFGGFDSKNAAWRACDALKRRSISCYAVQN